MEIAAATVTAIPVAAGTCSTAIGKILHTHPFPRARYIRIISLVKALGMHLHSLCAFVYLSEEESSSEESEETTKPKSKVILNACMLAE